MPVKTANIEYKSFHFELKSVDEDQGIIEGYLSTFGNVDQGKDRVAKGAFKKTLTEAKSRMQHKNKKYLWPVLWMHDPDKPLGGCLDAYEDDRGLYTKFQLDITTNSAGIPNNPLATMVFSGYKNGYIDEQSMGYKAIQKDYDDQGVRNLKECQVWEESCVTSLFAMNDQALVTNVKSASGKGKGMEKKDFNDRYREERIKDWLNTDFNNLVCALRGAIIDMFMIGDEPQSDTLNTILNSSAENQTGFIQAVEEYVQKGVDLGVSNYLSEQQRPASYYSDPYGYMTRPDDLEGKAKISKAGADQIRAHLETLDAVASNHMLSHKAITSIRADLAAMIGHDTYGQEGPANGDASQPENGTTKAANLEPQQKALNQETDQQPHNSTDPEVDALAAWLEQQLNNKKAA